MKLTQSKRFWASFYFGNLFTIFGFIAYWIHPEHIDNFAFFLGTVVLVILGYVTGESLRPSGTASNKMTHEKANNTKRNTIDDLDSELPIQSDPVG